jgi:protein-disulfide isomerase
MTRQSWGTVILLPLVFLLFAPPSGAQQKSIEELSRQIEVLSQSVKAMQKDLQDIKALLQGRAQAPTAQPPQNVFLDLEGHPTRGENAAKLTMVEFSDYQ